MLKYQTYLDIPSSLSFYISDQCNCSSKTWIFIIVLWAYSSFHYLCISPCSNIHFAVPYCCMGFVHINIWTNLFASHIKNITLEQDRWFSRCVTHTNITPYARSQYDRIYPLNSPPCWWSASLLDTALFQNFLVGNLLLLNTNFYHFKNMGCWAAISLPSFID